MNTNPILSVLKHLPWTFVILTVILIYQFVSMTDQPPANTPLLTVDHPAVIHTDLEEDKSQVKLNVGDTIRCLGLVEPESKFPAGFWVENAEGQRGIVLAHELGFTCVDRTKRDTLTILGNNTKDHKLQVQLADGTKEDRSYTSVAPVIPRELIKYKVSNNAHYYLSEEKFKKNFIGKSLTECDKLYRPASTISKEKNNEWQAYYRKIKVFNSKNGKYSLPVVTFNDSLICTGYTLVHPGGNNSWLLSWMPFVTSIIDFEPFAWLIKEPVYDFDAKIMNYSSDFDGNPKWYHWVYVGIYILFGLIWAYFMVGYPMKIMQAAMRCRFTFYHLDDSLLASLIALVGIVWFYIWNILIMSWGLVWLVAWILIPIALYMYSSSTSELSTVPHDRCENCRRMFSMHYVEREFMREYDEWRTVSKRGALLSQFTRHWTTYTQTTYSDGSTRNSNYQDHSETESTYAVHHYEVLYHVKEYHNVYKCSGCGHEERFRDEDLTELDRRYLSSGTFTETT